MDPDGLQTLSRRAEISTSQQKREEERKRVTFISSCKDSSCRNLLSVTNFSGSHCWKEKAQHQRAQRRGPGPRELWGSGSPRPGGEAAGTFMQRTAACLASWFSVDGPRVPDCSAPLSQVTKLSTADSPLGNTAAQVRPVLRLRDTALWQLTEQHRQLLHTYRLDGVSSLWREIFPLGSRKSST